MEEVHSVDHKVKIPGRENSVCPPRTLLFSLATEACSYVGWHCRHWEIAFPSLPCSSKWLTISSLGVPIFFLWPNLAANPRPAGLKRALSKLAFPQPGGTDFGGRALRADPHGMAFFFLFLPPFGLTCRHRNWHFVTYLDPWQKLSKGKWQQRMCYRRQGAEKGRSLDQVDTMKSANKFSYLRAFSLCNKLKPPLEALASGGYYLCYLINPPSSAHTVTAPPHASSTMKRLCYIIIRKWQRPKKVKW